MLEDWGDKLWVVLAAVISAFGGYVMYERKKIDGRLDRLEDDVADHYTEHKTELAAFKETLKNLKEDTEEIKSSQQQMLNLLIKRRK